MPWRLNRVIASTATAMRCFFFERRRLMVDLYSEHDSKLVYTLMCLERRNALGEAPQ